MTAAFAIAAAYLVGIALTRAFVWRRERTFPPAHRDPHLALIFAALWPVFWILIVTAWMEERDRG